MRRNRFKSRRGKKSRPFISYLRWSVYAAFGVLGVAMLSFALVTGHDFLTRSKIFSATSIQINGLKRLTQTEVLAQSQLKKGVNILSVNLPLIRKRVKSHQWISDVGISRRFPDTLEMTVTEQVPLAVVDLGRKFVINQAGDIFKKAEATDEKNFPLIHGLSFTDLNISDQPKDHLFKSVMAVLHLGGESGSVIPNRYLKAVHVDREIGLTLVAFDQPLVIRLGHQDYPAKFEVLTRLMAHFNARRATETIDWIDLNDPERVVMNLKGELTQKKEKEV